MDFKAQILQGIPRALPKKKVYDTQVNHAPKKKAILTKEEKKLALRNALRYFPEGWHAELATEFLAELETYGRIYMYRFSRIMRCMPGQYRSILFKVCMLPVYS